MILILCRKLCKCQRAILPPSLNSGAVGRAGEPSGPSGLVASTKAELLDAQKQPFPGGSSLMTHFMATNSPTQLCGEAIAPRGFLTSNLDLDIYSRQEKKAFVDSLPDSSQVPTCFQVQFVCFTVSSAWGPHGACPFQYLSHSIVLVQGVFECPRYHVR